jgi:hypothetical protein
MQHQFLPNVGKRPRHRTPLVRVPAALRLRLDEGRFQVVPIEAKQYALARDWIGPLSAPLRTRDALHLAAGSARHPHPPPPASRRAHRIAMLTFWHFVLDAAD